MRCFVLLALLVCILGMAWSAAIEQVDDSDKDAVPTDLLDVDTGVNGADDNSRQTRQFIAVGFGRPYGGFYGRPYGGGGFYGRPYGGYYGRPYGGYYGRPYYGGFYG